jgi:hypothetical protein
MTGGTKMLGQSILPLFLQPVALSSRKELYRINLDT